MTNVELRSAWECFLSQQEPTHAITLAYNNRVSGTSDPCYRISPDGELTKLRSGSDTAVRGHCLPMIRYVSLDDVQRDVKRLHRNVDRRLFGTRFNLPGSRRTTFLGFVEHREENIHAHLGWKVPPDRHCEFTSVIRDAWLRTSASASIDIIHQIDSGWARYMCKDSASYRGDAALLLVDSLPRS